MHANTLTPQGCLDRQARFRNTLARLKLDAALLTQRHHVFYFTGHWGSNWHAPLLLLPAAGEAVLVVAEGDTNAAADVVVPYESNHLATLKDNQSALAFEAMLPSLKPFRHLGVDEAARPWLLADHQLSDLSDALYQMRLIKDADEVACLRRAVQGVEAAYACARQHIRPGLCETELAALMHAAAIREMGEPVAPFGNDFQSNNLGGPFRRRAMQAGELIILDLGVQVKAYRSDTCRTFAVDGKPTDAQRQAHQRVVQTLDYIDQTIKPGVSAKQLYHDVKEMLEADNPRKLSWKFPHHLGHGIGLSVHEGPRLNPHYDDTFEAGNVITAEPGLYGDDLKAGIRLEQDYLVTETGVERLSNFPLEL